MQGNRRSYDEYVGGGKGELVAKAESPPEADSLDEQISSLLESIEVDVTANGPAAPPVQEEVQPPRPGKTRPTDRSKPASARPPARQQAAPSRRKARVAKEAALKRKPGPAPKAVNAQRRPAAKPRAHVQPRPRTRPRTRSRLFADPATRELAVFVIAGLMIGVAIGVLVALSG
jgi:hypothetical protein